MPFGFLLLAPEESQEFSQASPYCPERRCGKVPENDIGSNHSMDADASLNSSFPLRKVAQEGQLEHFTLQSFY